MTEYDDEPVRGLPGALPPGERILWQGAPDRATLARSAFHTRAVAIYFALLTAVALGTALPGGRSFTGAIATALCGIAGVALLHLLAWGAARSTVYTLTDRRIVLRIGIALPKCINIPLALVAAADLALHGDGTGDIPLRIAGRQRLGWLPLWPHARPWRFNRPEPMLRAVPEAARVAALVARACHAADPAARPAADAPAGQRTVAA